MKPPAYVPQVRLFQDWLQAHRQLSFPDYDALWQWSVNELPAFWDASFYDRVKIRAAVAHNNQFPIQRGPFRQFAQNFQLGVCGSDEPAVATEQAKASRVAEAEAANAVPF